MKRPAQRLALAGVLLATALVYAPNLDHPFQFDAERRIVGSRDKLEDPLVFVRAFGRSGYKEDTTRLLPNLSLSLDYALFGLDPLGYHLTNLTLHLINVWLLAGLGRRVLERLEEPDSQAPLWGAAIFALHPLNSEAVNYLNARSNLMATTFYLLALLCFLRASALTGSALPERLGRWLAFAVALAAALLSKELAITVVLMAPLLAWWLESERADPPHRQAGAALRAFAILAVIGIGLTALTGAYAAVERVFEDASVSTLLLHALEQARVMMLYLGLGVLPLPGLLNADRQLPHLDKVYADGGAAGLAVPVLCCLAILVGIALAIGFRRRAAFASFFLLWPFLTHAPTSLVRRSDVMVEYRTYLPMVGVCLVLGWAIDKATEAAGRRWAEPRAAALRGAVAVALFTLLAGATVARNLVWATPIEFWEDVARKSPLGARGHGNLGKALAVSGRRAEAIVHLRRAVEIWPRYAKAHYNLGVALAHERRGGEAALHLRRALAIEPRHRSARFNLGQVLASLGRMDEAAEHFRRVLALRPADGRARLSLGLALAGGGRLEEAAAQFRRAVEIEPGLSDASRALSGARETLKEARDQGDRGRALAVEGRREEAIAHLRRAVELWSRYAEAHHHLGAALAHQGRSEEAAEHLRRALEIRPRYASAHFSLGNLLADQGRIDEAIGRYRRVLELRPDHARAHYRLGSAMASRGRMDEAVEHFRRALEIEPELTVARQGLSRALAALGSAR